MIDEQLTPKNIIARCIADFVRRGGINIDDVKSVADAVESSLNALGYDITRAEITPCE